MFHLINDSYLDGDGYDNDAQMWDPQSGGNYQNTRSSVARRKNQYGTAAAGLSQQNNAVLSPATRRSKRNKKYTPETIDITHSDSEDDDDDIVVDEEEDDPSVLKVNCSLFSFLFFSFYLFYFYLRSRNDVYSAMSCFFLPGAVSSFL